MSIQIKSVNSNNSKELIQMKIVYWGPGESGKTTNFLRLKEMYDYSKKSKGYSIETTDGRTLWQDSIFLSFDFKIQKQWFELIIHLVTCTGQERFLSTREYVLDGADGIVFVADSDPKKVEQNRRSFRELISFANQHVPYVIQLNKRDLKEAISLNTFKEKLDLPPEEKYPDGSYIVYPVIALTGENVDECFQDLIGQVLIEYLSK